MTNPRPAYRFPKGTSGNPAGSRTLTASRRKQFWELKLAMREICPEAAEVVKRCLKSDDERVALQAAQIAFERGFGKPEQHADVSLTCHFAEVPATMEIGQWLERKGQPEGPAGDEWLRQRGATG